MTAYDPSFTCSSPLLERLGFRRRRRTDPDQGPDANGAPQDEAGDLLGRIGQFLERHKLEPSPFTLATAYEFVSGENEDLRREVDARISSLEPITIAWLKSIAKAGVEDANEQFDKTFDLLESNIIQFADTTQTAQRATREYGAVLASHAAELKQADVGQRQLVQVATVVAVMVQRTKKLEEQLADSQKQAKALKKNLDDVQRRANLDHLTGLPNRRAFDRLYDEQIIAAQAEMEPLCIAFCDVDHFKQVNDTHAGTVIMPSAAPGEIRTLADLGLATERKGGFRLDGARLTEALQRDPAGAAAMFTNGLFGIYATIDKMARSASAASNPGSLAGSINRYTTLKTTLGKESAKLAEKQEELRATLTSRFAITDSRVGASKSTLSFLQAQIRAWNGGND